MYRIFLCFIILIFVFSIGAASAQDSPVVELKNQYSGKCLTVKGGSTKHGAALMHKDCGTGGLDSIWEMRPEGAGYMITNRGSGLCLGIEHQSKKDGAVVTQVSPCGRVDTFWRIDDPSSGPASGFNYGKPIVIRNNNSNRCLALVTGNEIKQYGCPPHRAKTTWQFVEPPRPANQLARQNIENTTGRPRADDLSSVSGPRDLTVLTYNTHLFEDSQPAIFKPDDTRYEDTMRRHRIAARLRASGADIVALQEIWNYDIQSYFIQELRGTYPHAARVNSACTASSSNRLAAMLAPPALGLAGSAPLTVSNGLLLLSKWPLSDISFKRFPVYTVTGLLAGASKIKRIADLAPNDHDCWANKGVLTATVDVAGRKLRVGVSHTLTGEDDRRGEMSNEYVALTPFRLDGRAYFLALHKSVGANIIRMDDYGVSAGEGRMHGAGKLLVKYGASMSPNYVALQSFESKGRPYIFGLHRDVGANIWRVNDDPSTGLTLVTKKPLKMSPNYVAVTAFQSKGEAYIFGLHRDVGANIWRINDDPATGFTLVTKKPLKMSPNYVAVIAFEWKGRPHIFGLHRDVGANIWRINDDPATGFTLVTKKALKMSPNYVAVTAFQSNGEAYIFGLHQDVGANLWRITDNPSMGLELVKNERAWPSDYAFIKSFELNGHPYLFGLKRCCGQYPDPCFRSRPEEAHIVRINDDPATGWEETLQMEDIKIIAEETITAAGFPAVMLGDLNVHATKYPIMDRIFRIAGARDAYVAVHGENMGNFQTLDIPSNKLALHFDPEKTSRTEGSFDRIDYIYVKESGNQFSLRPVEAHVIRDWKYDDGAKANMDLSDHYPLIITFRIASGRENGDPPQ